MSDKTKPDPKEKAPKETIRVKEGESPEHKALSLTLEKGSEAEEPGAEDAPRRKRGRPKGSRNRKKKAPTPEEIAEARQKEAEEMAPLLFQGVRAFVDRRWPDKPYTPEEAVQLAAAVVPVAHKHADSLSQWKEEIALALVVGIQFIAARALPEMDAKTNAAKREQSTAPEAEV